MHSLNCRAHFQMCHTFSPPLYLGTGAQSNLFVIISILFAPHIGILFKAGNLFAKRQKHLLLFYQPSNNYPNLNNTPVYFLTKKLYIPFLFESFLLKYLSFFTGGCCFRHSFPITLVDVNMAAVQRSMLAFVGMCRPIKRSAF